MRRDDHGEVLLRSRDRKSFFTRGANGLLQELPPESYGDWQGDERHRTLAETADRHGLWNHLNDELRASARHDVATGCYLLDWDLLQDRVQFFADGEELAEGGVERFLAGLAPALDRLGLPITVETVLSPYKNDQEDDYVIVINGIRCTVWVDQEWHDGSPVWTDATVRPLAVVNQLLADVTTVRAHTLIAGGNEGLALLLDPGVAEAMRQSGLYPEDAIPALAR